MGADPNSNTGAALRAHYDSVRKYAIELLGKDSISMLERIIEKEADTEIGEAVRQRLAYLDKRYRTVG